MCNNANMKTLVVVAVLATAIAIHDAQGTVWRDYRQVTPKRRTSSFLGQAREGDDPKCNGLGKQCDPDDCKNIIVCLKNKDGELESQPAGACGEDLFCSGNGNCTTNESPECSIGKTKFQCNNEGMFPDQANCHKYHYCIENDSKFDEPETTTLSPGDNNLYDVYSRKCKTGRGYNPRTGYCDKVLAGQKCVGYPVPMCTDPGSTAALKENPSIYYICLQNPQATTTLYPFLYLCPDGQVYDGNYGCK